MTTDDTHAPTKEFVDHLEWEVVSAFRRETRLDEQRRSRQTPWLRAAAVVLVSLAIGATAGLASAQMRDGARRDSLLDAAKADAALAALRLDLAQQQAADAKRKADVGAITVQSLLDAEAQLRLMEALAMRAKYNIDEINASALPPRDDLGAPLVKGRDFVKDRIQLDLFAAQQRLTALEAAQTEAERRVRVGAALQATQIEAQGEVLRARAALAALAARLNLRKEFLEKGTPVDELSRRLREAELRGDAYTAQQSLSLAQARLALIEKQRSAGVVGDVELLSAQLQVREQQIELQRLSERLRAVRPDP